MLFRSHCCHLLMAANGSSVARGASWLRNKQGEQVLPDGIDLIEDPHRARVAGSRAFDGEGLPTARRAIVEAGVLQGWTLDLATARKLDGHSTANAMRGTSSPPSPGNWNVSLTQGTKSRVRDYGRIWDFGGKSAEICPIDWKGPKP